MATSLINLTLRNASMLATEGMSETFSEILYSVVTVLAITFSVMPNCAKKNNKKMGNFVLNIMGAIFY